MTQTTETRAAECAEYARPTDLDAEGRREVARRWAQKYDRATLVGKLAWHRSNYRRLCRLGAGQRLQDDEGLRIEMTLRALSPRIRRAVARD